MKRRQVLAGLAATVPALATSSFLPQRALAATASGPFRPDRDSLAKAWTRGRCTPGSTR